MHEAMQETIKKFVSQLNKVGGDNIQRVSVIITGTPAIADPSKEILSSGNGILNVAYQTETIKGPLLADVTLIIVK